MFPAFPSLLTLALGTVELELPSPTSLLKSCQLLLKSPRYEQVRTFGTWLMPVLQKAIVQ